MNIDELPTTDVTLWNISNVSSSATLHPIYFMHVRVRPPYFQYSVVPYVARWGTIMA